MPIMFWKRLAGMPLLLALCSHALADDCVTRTGNNATIILPSDLTSTLENGDRVSAHFGGLCVGWAIYQEGKAAALTVWGDDDMTRGVDGVPEGEPFALAVTAGAGAESMEATVLFEGGASAVYRRDAILVARQLQGAGSSGDAPLDGGLLAVASASSSSHDGNGPGGAVDGQPRTRWSARGDGEWLRLDLGRSRRLGAVEVAWFRGHRRQAYFDVEVSDDGASWRRAFAGASSGRTSEPERYALAGSARFVRLVGHGNAENDWNSITEVKVYGEVAGVGAALAVASASSSSHDGNGPGGAVDGQPRTRWSARGDGEWLRLDLGRSRRLGAVEVAWFRGHRRQAYFDVEVSDDGASWRRAFAGASSGRTSEPERYALAGSARFVRLVGHGNAENTWNSVVDVRLYEGRAERVAAGKLAGTSAELAPAPAEGASLEAAQDVPTSFALDQNYPNPFNPSTTITYRLPQATAVTLTIYDAAGRRVQQLANHYQEAGEHRIRWDGRDAAGAPVGSGLYVYQIEAESFRQARTMMLVK